MPTDEKQASAKIATYIASRTWQVSVKISSEFRAFFTVNLTFLFCEYTDPKWHDYSLCKHKNNEDAVSGRRRWRYMRYLAT